MNYHKKGGCRMMKIGENIKRLREKAGFTQESMARQMGTQSAFVSALECGKRNPGPATMAKLQDVFGLDEQTIRFGKRDDSEPSHDEDRRIAPLKRLIFAELDLLQESEQAEVLRLVLEMKEARKQS
jgi:transcriptional regulator with XRE-family HTH domain